MQDQNSLLDVHSDYFIIDKDLERNRASLGTLNITTRLHSEGQHV